MSKTRRTKTDDKHWLKADLTDRPYPPGTAWDEAWRERQMKRKYRDALKKIANLYWQDAPYPQEMREIAKEALEANYGE